MIRFKKKFYQLNLNNLKFRLSLNSILIFSCFLVGSYALIFWVSTINQPIIDLHAFRQAQTAISARYLGIDGSNVFNYHTPVLGYPWHLPFEFPIFQILTKLVSSIFSIELTLTGRLLNLIIGIFNFFIALKVLSKYNPTNKVNIFSLFFISHQVYIYIGIELF